jgi:Mn-containing catalase
LLAQLRERQHGGEHVRERNPGSNRTRAATRLYEVTDGPGMKDMLASLIARDTMHQNQWLAAIEDMGGNRLPIPNSFLQDMEESGIQLRVHG